MGCKNGLSGLDGLAGWFAGFPFGSRALSRSACVKYVGLEEEQTIKGDDQPC